MPGMGPKKNPGNFLNISFLKRENPYFCSPFWGDLVETGHHSSIEGADRQKAEGKVNIPP
jgi:hypothetical protein